MNVVLRLPNDAREGRKSPEVKYLFAFLSLLALQIVSIDYLPSGFWPIVDASIHTRTQAPSHPGTHAQTHTYTQA